MSDYKPEYLKKYVQLAVRMGINIQKGQNLVINAPVECAYFVRLAVEEAYNAGAREVFLRWGDDACMRSQYLLASDDKIFDEFPAWTKMMYNDLSKGGAAFMTVLASNPEALKGVDMNRVVRTQKATTKALKDYRERMMSSQSQWCIASVPSSAWAKKVFPGLENEEKAKQALWDAIYAASRVDDNDAIVNWKNHVSTMKKNVEILNNYHFKSLHYKNGIGTDLTVELPETHIWNGAGDTAKNGVPFLPNIPTEEVFTAPKRDGVNGRVIGSKPIVYSGNVIENFSFTFKNGKCIDYQADTNKDVLDKLVTTLKNMDYLGEVALVPFNSPISNMNTLFYNTLYDENASCHLALGEAYPDCIKGGVEMNTRERLKAGINKSDGHHDFMIGTSDLTITGITYDGKEIPVFINGDFAF